MKTTHHFPGNYRCNVVTRRREGAWGLYVGIRSEDPKASALHAGLVLTRGSTGMEAALAVMAGFARTSRRLQLRIRFPLRALPKAPFLRNADTRATELRKSAALARTFLPTMECVSSRTGRCPA